MKKYLFIIGLHRSGTTLLSKTIAANKAFSGFEDTGVPMDEGQFLQSVYPPAKIFGGPGIFGFHQDSHLTEYSPLLTQANKNLLKSEWEKFWDLSKEIYVEKSPPNILKTRFLQEIFPNSYFLLIKRHPIATSLSTRKGSRTSLRSLLNHWIYCHQKVLEDSFYLKNFFQVKYEDFVSFPKKTFRKISNYLSTELDIPENLSIDKTRNNIYFDQWKDLNILKKIFLTYYFEKSVQYHGYSMIKYRYEK